MLFVMEKAGFWGICMWSAGESCLQCSRVQYLWACLEKWVPNFKIYTISLSTLMFLLNWIWYSFRLTFSYWWILGLKLSSTFHMAVSCFIIDAFPVFLLVGLLLLEYCIWLFNIHHWTQVSSLMLVENQCNMKSHWIRIPKLWWKIRHNKLVLW